MTRIRYKIGGLDPSVKPSSGSENPPRLGRWIDGTVNLSFSNRATLPDVVVHVVTNPRILGLLRNDRRQVDSTLPVGHLYLSNVKGVGGGVLERKIDFGPGYRIYFGKDGETLVILLGGSTK